MAGKRALIVVRLSRMTEASTSPERQREVCERFCADRGYRVVGVAEDLDVSAGTVSPFDRPQLRPWLGERSVEFDVIVFYRADRIIRRVVHLSRLIEWSEERGKQLVSATEPMFDLTTSMGQAVAVFISAMGQMELDAISERNSNAAQYNIRAGKYRGSTTPVGYRAEKDGAGDWRLIPDEGGLAPVIRDVIGRVIAGERAASIVADLNARGVQTHKDRQADLMGRPTTGRKWTINNLRRMLCSPTIIGQVVHRPALTDDEGKPIKGKGGEKQYGPEQVLFEDGAPLVRAEPLVSAADFYAAKRIIDDRREAEPKQRRSAETSLLVNVLFCGHCGAPMWKLKGGPGRTPRYRCASAGTGKSCGNRSVTIPEADGRVLDLLFAALGNLPHIEKVYAPGVDNSSAIAEIDAQLLSLSSAVDRFPASSPAWESMMEKVDSLTAAREAREAEGDIEAGYQYVRTGATFGQYWQNLSSAGRNDYLRDHGMRVTFLRMGDDEPDWQIDPGDIATMIEAVSPGSIAATQAKLAEFGLPTDDLGLILSSIERTGPEAELPSGALELDRP
ncbi:recombinase family protein [Actinomycetospora sp. CA-053990]|uniref:recombinase family protein n=1 Tax=Actinomycetospora sp. CA-053990 TaxID=3239891 RepID=UPI003D8ECD9B